MGLPGKPAASAPARPGSPDPIARRLLRPTPPNSPRQLPIQSPAATPPWAQSLFFRIKRQATSHLRKKESCAYDLFQGIDELVDTGAERTALNADRTKPRNWSKYIRAPLSYYEINGGASMGAGALEAPTKKLRDYPILDVTQLKAPAKKKLISLAEAVWKKESPVDWGTDKWTPSRHLRGLDEWVLKTAGSSVTVSQLYEDLRATCTARIVVADDKKRKTKKRQSDSIGNVAESIVQSIEPKLKTKNFPDDFADGATLDLPLLFDRNSLRSITIGHLLDSYDIEVHTKTGAVAYSGTHTRPVAEAIVRALLLGRSTFSVSTDRNSMDG